MTPRCSVCANVAAVAEEDAGEWEVLPKGTDMATDANANDLVPPPVPMEAAVVAKPISPFAAAQPAAGVQVSVPTCLPSGRTVEGLTFQSIMRCLTLCA